MCNVHWSGNVYHWFSNHCNHQNGKRIPLLSNPLSMATDCYFPSLLMSCPQPFSFLRVVPHSLRIMSHDCGRFLSKCLSCERQLKGGPIPTSWLTTRHAQSVELKPMQHKFSGEASSVSTALGHIHSVSKQGSTWLSSQLAYYRTWGPIVGEETCMPLDESVMFLRSYEMACVFTSVVLCLHAEEG